MQNTLQPGPISQSTLGLLCNPGPRANIVAVSWQGAGISTLGNRYRQGLLVNREQTCGRDWGVRVRGNLGLGQLQMDELLGAQWVGGHGTLSTG